MRYVGHQRSILFSGTLSAVGSTGIGNPVNVGAYSRIVGMFSIVGSATFRLRIGPASGSYIVSSTTTVNSGPATFDAINYGRFCDFGVTAINSQVMTALLIGEGWR